jgi:hypothetical protein
MQRSPVAEDETSDDGDRVKSHMPWLFVALVIAGKLVCFSRLASRRLFHVSKDRWYCFDNYELRSFVSGKVYYGIPFLSLYLTSTWFVVCRGAPCSSIHSVFIVSGSDSGINTCDSSTREVSSSKLFFVIEGSSSI